METRLKLIITPHDKTVAGRAEHVSSARWALAGLSLAMLLPSLGTSIANVALPTLAEAFGASFQQVQWVVLAYLLAITTLIIGVGRLGDLTGRRRLLLAGIVLFTASSAVCGVAPTLPLLIAAWVVQGLGAAIMMALTMGQDSPQPGRAACTKGSPWGLICEDAGRGSQKKRCAPGKPGCYTRPRARANATASSRLWACSLPMMLWTWRLTVPMATTNSAAIAWLERPRASSRSTSSSRSVSGSPSGVVTGGGG